MDDLTVSELQQRRDATSADARRFITIAERENRDLSAQEKTDFDALSRKCEIFDARIERLLTVKAMTPPSGRRTRPPQIASPYDDSPSFSRRTNGTAPSGSVTEFRDVRTGRPIFGFSGGASIMSHLAEGNPQAEVFAQPGAIGRWVQYVASPNRDTRFLLPDERNALVRFANIVTGDNIHGGYLVPEAYLSGAFIDRLRAKMVIMQAGATVLPLESDSNFIGQLAAGPTFVGSHAEGVQESTTDLSFSGVTLVPETVMAVLRISDEWLQDAIQGPQIVEQTLINEMANKLDSYALVGTGSAQLTGLVNFAGINAVVQAPATADYDDVLDMLDKIRQDNVEPNAWVLSSATNTVLAKLKKNSEANNYSDAPTDIAGLKKFVSEGVTSSYCLMGDFSAFLWGVRQDILIKRESQIDRNSQLISVTCRVDFAATHAESFCKMSA